MLDRRIPARTSAAALETRSLDLPRHSGHSTLAYSSAWLTPVLALRGAPILHILLRSVASRVYPCIHRDFAGESSYYCLLGGSFVRSCFIMLMGSPLSLTEGVDEAIIQTVDLTTEPIYSVQRTRARARVGYLDR